jgi:hypothetical protein
LQPRAEEGIIGYLSFVELSSVGLPQNFILFNLQPSTTLTDGLNHFFPVMISVSRWHRHQDTILDSSLELANGVPEIH